MSGAHCPAVWRKFRQMHTTKGEDQNNVVMKMLGKKKKHWLDMWWQVKHMHVMKETKKKVANKLGF